MSTLNLQQLLSSDSIGDLVTKLNQNFSQVATNGGGPQGGRGVQGPPGLPGLRGESGPAGDAGEDAKQVTIVNDDPNWPGVYAGDPLGNTDASAAIAAGYNEGDIWIDSANGIFYDIHDIPANSGQYFFVPHPISVAAITAGNFWDLDTNYDTGTNDNEQGVRLTHRFATMSLTSETPSIPTAFESSQYDDGILLSNIGAGGTTSYGYNRPAFRLSIDSTSKADAASVRITTYAPGAVSGIAFGSDNENYAPLVYLNSTDTADGKGFGFLHQLYTYDEGGIQYADILSLNSDNNLSMFLIDTKMMTLSSDCFAFISTDNVNDKDKILSFITEDRDGTQLADANLWLSMASTPTSTKGPFGTNEPVNNLGLRVTRDGTEGYISSYIPYDDASTQIDVTTDHVMSVIQGGVHITSDDDVKDTASKILRDFTFGVENDDINWGRPSERIMALKNYRGNSEPDTFLGMGTAEDAGVIYSANGGTFPNNSWRRLILNPNNSLLPGTINVGYSDNDGEYGVSIGAEFNSRFGIEGNFAVGQGTYQTNSAPDYGGIIQGQVAIGRDNAKEGNRLHVSDGGISIDTNEPDESYIGFNTYYDGDYRHVDTGLASHFRYTTAAPATRLGYFTETGGIADSTYASIKESFSIVHATGNVGIGIPVANAIEQRLVVDKVGLPFGREGLQILDSSTGMVGINAGLQFRLDGGNTGQIGFTDTAQSNNDIDIYTAGRQRQRILGEDGRLRIQTNSTGIMLDPRGTASVDIASADDYNIASVSMGTFENDNVQGLDSNIAGGYVGYNAEYDADATAVTYHSRDDASDPASSGAGAISFVDNRGRFHVAVYKEGDLNTTEETIR